MQDARASAAIALIELAHNIPVWAPEWSIFFYDIMQFFVLHFVMLKLSSWLSVYYLPILIRFPLFAPGQICDFPYASEVIQKVMGKLISNKLQQNKARHKHVLISMRIVWHGWANIFIFFLVLALSYLCRSLLHKSQLKLIQMCNPNTYYMDPKPQYYCTANKILRRIILLSLPFSFC